MTESTLEQIRTQIQRMRALARSPEVFTRNERVSGWCIAEHLDHMYRVAMSVVRRLADTSVEPMPGRINFMGRFVLLTHWIPRGRGKAPQRLSGKLCTVDDLEHSLEKLEREFEALPFAALRASRARTVPHQYFGALTPSQALRFMVVHTKHHLRIIRDIVR